MRGFPPLIKIKINVYDRLDNRCEVLLGENDPPFFPFKKNVYAHVHRNTCTYPKTLNPRYTCYLCVYV